MLSELQFYSVRFEYENNDFKTLKFKTSDLCAHYQAAYLSKKIAVTYISPNDEFRVELYCINMSSIYKMLTKLNSKELEEIKNKKKLLEYEMKIEEEVGEMIARAIPIKENARFIVFGDTHSDNMLMNIGIQLHKITKLMTIHLGDISKARSDKWYQNIDKETLNSIRDKRAQEMMENCIQWSAINDVKGPFIVLKGNHDNTLKISNVCLLAVSPKLQLVFQHAFMPSQFCSNIKLSKRFHLYNDEYKDFEFLLLETSDEYIGHFHFRYREDDINYDAETKYDIEENVTKWIRMLMKPEYTYNPFMYYAHEINSFNISVNIDLTLTIPMKKAYYKTQKDVTNIIHPQKTSLFHRIIPIDGMDGSSKDDALATVGQPRTTNISNQSVKIVIDKR